MKFYKKKILSFIFIIILCLCLLKYYYIRIEYYSQIWQNRYKRDYTRWILSDKYVAKEYARLNGFDVPKTYFIEKYPKNIDFASLPSNFVIKPTDMCDSGGVYLVKDGKNILNGKQFDRTEYLKEYGKLRAEIGSEYYMHEKMNNGLVPFSGVIVEELLLDNNEIPYDYKCYTFGGKLYFIAVTFNRRIENGKQMFNCVWFTKNWKPIYFSMVKNRYLYESIKKPDNLEILIKKVENMSKKLRRHCRIDVYNINNKIYLGEYTFFCGAFIHTFICNLILGIIWLLNKDDYKTHDPVLYKIVPEYYNKFL